MEYKVDPAAVAQIAKEHAELADRLEHCVVLLQHHIRCLRGEETDMTGLGLGQIFRNALEYADDCKVIEKYQWEYYKKLCFEDEERKKAVVAQLAERQDQKS